MGYFDIYDYFKSINFRNTHDGGDDKSFTK